MDLKAEGKFRYNGEDLAMMKNLALTTDPHVAVESFIERAIQEMRDPNEMLAEYKKVYKEVAKGSTNG